MISESNQLPNYFSVDDILATQEKAPCKILVNLPKLGKLNASSEENDLNAGSTLELPIWLVEELIAGRQPVISADFPKIYKPAYREVLKADATAVDLHKFSLYFYDLGCHVALLDSRSDVADILVHTFSSRFKQLLDLADSTGLDPRIIDKLDTLERRLFKEGHAARNQLLDWMNNSVNPITAATMVINHRKRKRASKE